MQAQGEAKGNLAKLEFWKIPQWSIYRIGEAKNIHRLFLTLVSEFLANSEKWEIDSCRY